MASWTNIPNANLAAGAPIRSVDILAIKENTVYNGEVLRNKQVFTSSGTFNVPANVHRVKVSVIGAGGNGSNGTTNTDNGCGGGAGGYILDFVGVTAGGTASVTVGTNAGTRTSSFTGTSTITAAGGSNGSGTQNAGGTNGVSGAATIFGQPFYTAGPCRRGNTALLTENVINLSGSTNNLISGFQKSFGGVYAHGFGIGGVQRAATSGDNQHIGLGYGAGGGGGVNPSGFTGGGVGTNGLVVVEW